MTVLQITIDDADADYIKKVLNEFSAIKSVEEVNLVDVNGEPQPESAVERIKKILERAKGKNLFAEIEDPSEWQREIRKKWA